MPMAMPMSAILSAGASLTPSPVMATTSPVQTKTKKCQTPTTIFEGNLDFFGHFFPNMIFARPFRKKKNRENVEFVPQKLRACGICCNESSLRERGGARGAGVGSRGAQYGAPRSRRSPRSRWRGSPSPWRGTPHGSSPQRSRTPQACIMAKKCRTPTINFGAKSRFWAWTLMRFACGSFWIKILNTT